VIYWYSTTTSGTIFTNCSITTIIVSDFVISSTTTELNAVAITGNTLNFPKFMVS
jgi:hypothetical protein